MSECSGIDKIPHMTIAYGSEPCLLCYCLTRIEQLEAENQEYAEAMSPMTIPLRGRIEQLERVIVNARREFRRGGDAVDANAWLFRVTIDEGRYADESA